MKFLDSTGLAHLWSKMKDYVGGQIGAIDRTLYKVITKLPDTSSEAAQLGCTDVNKIYLVSLGVGSPANQEYAEYLYRGTNFTTNYNKSNWEKLGSFRSTVDLSNYLDKTTDQTIGSSTASVQIGIYGDINFKNDWGITGGNRKGTEVFTSDGGYLDISAYAKKTEIPNVSGKVDKVTVSGSGNAVTAASISGSTLTLTKGTTFLTAHQDISGKSNIDHTHKVKINGVVKTITASGTADANLTDLGTYLTEHQALNTLTLQKNGQQIGTYNPRTASTLNITVPTKLSGFTDDVVAGKYLPLTGGIINRDLDYDSGILSVKTSRSGYETYFTNIGAGYISLNDIILIDADIPSISVLNGTSVDSDFACLYTNGLLIRNSESNSDTQYFYNEIYYKNNSLSFPSKSGTIALTSDIPTVQALTNDDIDKAIA